jgi:F0F1-type ATP synthase assembly protein I
MKSDRPPSERSFIVKFGEYSQAAFILPASIFVGYAIGYMLDKWLGTTWLYMVFLLLGIAAGLVQVIRFANRHKD